MNVGRIVSIPGFHGGRVQAVLQRDGLIDLSVIAPEGPSAAVYVDATEFAHFATDVLAHTLLESGAEIGEAIERARQ